MRDILSPVNFGGSFADLEVGLGAASFKPEYLSQVEIIDHYKYRVKSNFPNFTLRHAKVKLAYDRWPQTAPQEFEWLCTRIQMLFSRTCREVAISYPLYALWISEPIAIADYYG